MTKALLRVPRVGLRVPAHIPSLVGDIALRVPAGISQKLLDSLIGEEHGATLYQTFGYRR